MEYKNIYHFLLFKNLQSMFKDLEFCNYALIKGEVLSVQEYGKEGKRDYNDIDILIDPMHITAALHIITKYGFKFKNSYNIREQIIKAKLYSHQLPTLIKRFNWGIVTMDINFYVKWDEYNEQKGICQNFLNHRKIMNIYGVKVETLTLVYSFLHMILHHYREMNSLYDLLFYNEIPNKLFRDVYMMLQTNKKQLTPEILKFEGDKNKIKKYIFYMIYYTKQYYKTEEFDSYLEALFSNEALILLDEFGLEKKYRWDLDLHKRIKAKNIGEIVYKIVGEEAVLQIKETAKFFCYF